jgi:hypothetical protein
MLGKLSIVAAIAALLVLPGSAFARGGGRIEGVHVNKSVSRNVTRNVDVNRNVNVNRSVNRNVNVRVGQRYNGGIWYGTGRHYWHGRWYPYGVGSCWSPTPIGYVWICG